MATILRDAIAGQPPLLEEESNQQVHQITEAIETDRTQDPIILRDVELEIEYTQTNRTHYRQTARIPNANVIIIASATKHENSR